jgi:recombination protein RecT
MPTNQIQKKQSTTPTIADQIQDKRFLRQLSTALGPTIDAEHYARGVLTTILTDPTGKLIQCDARSVLRAILTTAQIGLEIDAKGHAFLIPFKNREKKILEAQVMPGYKGYLFTALKSAIVKDVYVALVYEGDKFEVQRGTDPKIIHIEEVNSDRYGDDDFITHVYSVIRYISGAIDFEIMTKAQLFEVKNSLRYESDIWVKHFGEMAKKTVIRRHAKRWQFPQVNNLSLIDDTVSSGALISMDEKGNQKITRIAEQEPEPVEDNPDETAALNTELKAIKKKHNITGQKLSAYMYAIYPDAKWEELTNAQRREFIDYLKKDYKDV